MCAYDGKMERKQKRKQKRYPISINVKLNTPDISIEVMATNISCDGFGLQSLKSVPPATQAKITMASPVAATFYGSLTWSRHTLIKGLDAYEMGFEAYAILHQGTMADTTEGKEEIIQKILTALGEIEDENVYRSNRKL